MRRAIDYALQIMRGLAAAHERGILHRDLKPDNIFITKDGRAKILDFGLAKLVLPELDTTGGVTAATKDAGTGEGKLLGTVGYMSPEQVRGGAIDARSDLFSFGVVLYEMVSGQRAFKGDDDCGHDQRDFEGGSAGFDDRQSGCAADAGADRAALPGEGAGSAVSIGERCGVRFGVAVDVVDVERAIAGDGGGETAEEMAGAGAGGRSRGDIGGWLGDWASWGVGAPVSPSTGN